MRIAVTLALGCWLWLAASSAKAQQAGDPSALQVLPLTRAEVALWELGIPSDARTLLLRGTVSSALDGSLYDPLHALDGDRVPRGGPSLLRLPPGTRVLQADPHAHRYVVELAPDGQRALRIDTRQLARAHWTTRHAALESLSGAFEVGVLDGSTAATAAAIEARSSRPRDGAVPMNVGADARGLLWCALCGLVLLLWRVRRTPERLLSARAARALSRLRAEQRRQGPVFVELISAAEALWQSEGQAALTQLRAAARESRRFVAARAVLDQRYREALGALRTIVQTLEHSAAHLTEHGVVQLDRERLRAFAHALESQTASSLEADREARAL